MQETTPLVLLTKFVAAREKNPRWSLFALKSEVVRLLPDNRVNICYHHRLPQRETVEIWYKTAESRAYYCGLMKCGQIWSCPICAQRAALIRREMLRTAIENSRTKYVPLMVTYTARHYAGMRLSHLLAGMTAAYRTMRQARIWRTYKDEYLVRGEIRAVEITFGDAGWHPHFHTVLFLDKSILEYYKRDNGEYDLFELRGSLERHLTPEWIASLNAHKLTAENGPALNVKSGWEKLTDYITKGGEIMPTTRSKWGLPEEMTMGQLKQSKRDGESPWQLLARSFCGESASGDLFREYVSATKGKSSLQWTPGLKAELGVMIDEEREIATEEGEARDILLSVLTTADWRAVVETGAEGILLDKASTGDPAEVAKIVAEAYKRQAEPISLV